MKTKANPIRDALYENPGPRTRKIVALITVVSVILLAVIVYAVIRRFYDTGQLDGRYWSFFLQGTTWSFIGMGLIGTMEAALLAAAIAFVMGFVFMRARISNSKLARMIGTALVEFTRGVPTLLFIYFFLLVVPQTGLKLPPLLKIALPVAISASGVVAEAFRSGVNAVPSGQKEAGLSLGMRDRHVFYKIIFPQAFRYIVPALIAELVIVVKDTTFAYVVSFPDLMQNARVLISNYDAMLSVYTVAAVIYILINYLLNRLSERAAGNTSQTGKVMNGVKDE